MLDQFLDHISVRTESLADWIDAVCDDDLRRRCRTTNENHGFTINGVEATDETRCYVNNSVGNNDYLHKSFWLTVVGQFEIN